MDKKIECGHPNCRLSATKMHPNNNKGLCNEHYHEIINAIRHAHRIIILTCPNESELK